MTPYLKREQAVETYINRYVTEASDIGLLPGSWPVVIHTDLGNKQPLYRQSAKRTDDDEIIHVTYSQGNGCITVIVLND